MSEKKLLKLLRGLIRLPRRILILPIRFYRRFLSPLKGSVSCRFHPTCSEYAIEAITEWGAVVGGALALWRILRCNPFGGFGNDPVPMRKKKTKQASCGAKDEQQPHDGSLF